MEVIPAQAEPLPALPAASEPPSLFLQAKPAFGSLWEVGGVPLRYGPGPGGRGGPPTRPGQPGHMPGANMAAAQPCPQRGWPRPQRGIAPPTSGLAPPPSLLVLLACRGRRRGRVRCLPTDVRQPSSASMSGGSGREQARDGGGDLPADRVGSLRPWGP